MPSALKNNPNAEQEKKNDSVFLFAKCQVKLFHLVNLEARVKINVGSKTPSSISSIHNRPVSEDLSHRNIGVAIN